MGGLTLVDVPAISECHNAGIKNLSCAEALNQLAIDTGVHAGQNQSCTSGQQQANASFSVSEFLVPSLHSKAWEDWQVADELNPFATGSQEWACNHVATPFQFDLDGMWDPTDTAVMGLPADQAYDEFVFDLAPSNFATPTTVNVADLIVDPDSMAHSVSPLELVMPTIHAGYNNYRDLDLVNLYGFTDQEIANLDTNLSDIESLSDNDGEEEDEEEETDKGHAPTDQHSSDLARAAVEQDGLLDHDLNTVVAMTLATVECSEPSMTPSESHQDLQHNPAIWNPNKRRMEEDLAARIGSDLSPEHMAGLFKILKRFSGQEVVDGDGGDDEEMQVDLSRLDETTLVELYQYVEACCMQTVGTILAAEERERKRAMAATKAEREALERKRCYEQRTTEQSSGYSSSSSSPPSPSYPSSPVNGCGSSNDEKRSATASTVCATLYEHSGVEEEVEACWMAAQHKSKRKRAKKNDPACVGGGGAGNGRRRQRFFEHAYADDMEMRENDEIDIVGI